METRTEPEADSRDDTEHAPPSWLLLIPGCTLIGMSLGLFLGQPGFGMLGGLGVGFVWWGLILAGRL